MDAAILPGTGRGTAGTAVEGAIDPTQRLGQAALRKHGGS